MKTNRVTLKVGDKLVCHTKCRVENSYDSTTIGKIYVITHINMDQDKFCIIDDGNDNHYFYYNDDGKTSSYEKWFHPAIRIERKQKLEKLKNIYG